ENHIEQYILDQSSKSNPKILFIPTASAEPPDYIENFYKVFNELDCNPDHLSLFKRTPNLKKLFAEQDIFFVGGGNTKSMLAVWKEWEIDQLLKYAYQEGKIMSGVSAGAICWFEKGVTDSWDNELRMLDCLGFIQGNCCPHYDEEPDRIPYTRKFLKEGLMDSIHCIEGGSALHFINESVKHNVSFQESKKSYIVSIKDNEILTKAYSSISI
ncbi:MAG: peptidase E, partial [Candidatus Neomarinimicrobiota bacterium]